MIVQRYACLLGHSVPEAYTATLSWHKEALNQCWFNVGLMYIVKTRLTDQFKQEWYSDINTLRKCCSYRLFKTDFALEPYLLTLSYNNRITLCKFRVSDHKLAIELGRHLNIPNEERYCNLCQQGKIGNEYHFLLECNALVIIRRKYMSEMYHTNHSNWKFRKKNTKLSWWERITQIIYFYKRRYETIKLKHSLHSTYFNYFYLFLYF